MRRFAVPLLAIVAMLALWLYSTSPADDTVSFPSEVTASIGRASSDAETKAPNPNSDAMETEPNPENPVQETQALLTGTESATIPRAGSAEDRYLAETQARVLAECEPSRDFVDLKALQCALDFEEVDSNRGPLVEAAVMGSYAENPANLLSVTVR